MKKNFITRAFAVVLSIIIFAVPMFLTASADSAQTIGYEVQDRSADKGGNVTVPIIIKSNNGKTFDINGIRFSVKYDSDKLEYVASASSSLISGLSSFNNGNVVSFAWFETESCKLSSNITIATVSFKVKDDATGDAKLTFTSQEIYKSAVSGGVTGYQMYTCTTPTVNAKVTIGTDSAVQKVIDAIDAIGTVKHDDATLEKIQNASKLYGKLTVAQKAKVTNYDKLTAASKKYSELADEESKAKIKAEVEKFKTEHKKALDIKLDDLKIGDYETIENAYNKFGTGNGKLSPLAQAELLTEYRRLGYFLEVLKDAKAAEDEKKQLEIIKKREKDNARVYVFGGHLVDPQTGKEEKDWTVGLLQKKSGWTDVLSKTKKNVTANDYSRLDFFKSSWYDPMIGLYPEIENIMNDECDGLAKQLMDAYKQAKKLYDIENPVLTPEQQAANDFITKFTYVLSLTEKTVGYDDLSQIEIALSVYEFLSDGAKELLSDQYALLQKLKAKASGMTPSNSNNGGDVVGPGAYNTKAEANSFYNAFNQTWAKVFAMNTESVTAEDYPVLLAMITNYETLCSLNPEVAGLLAEPMKSVYAMYDKAAALYGDGSRNGSTVAGPAAGWDSNNVLEFLGRDVGVVIWILLGLLLLSTTTFVVLIVYYRNLKKNKALFAEEVAL